MVLTPSIMADLGFKAPDFKLPNTASANGSPAFYTLADAYKDPSTQGVLVAFVCNHCPYVIHILDKLTQISNEYQTKGIKTIFISANDVTSHPQDRPELMTKLATEQGFKFPYLYDESQAIAKAYQAACTPDFFLFDKEKQLVYRGQFDASRPGNEKPITGEDLTQAFDALLTGASIKETQVASVGCNIKWRDE